MVISAKEILKKKVAIRIGKLGDKDTVLKNVMLKDVLFNLNDKMINTIKRLRECEYKSKEYNEIKSKIPVMYPCGTFNYRAADNDVCDYSNILSIDIDHQDNPNVDMDELQKTIFNLPYVFCCYKSCGGKGLYALIPVEDGRNTPKYQNCLVAMFYELYGVKLDTQCNNVARARFVSYDENYKKFTKRGDVDVWWRMLDKGKYDGNWKEIKKYVRKSDIFSTFFDKGDSLVDDIDFCRKCVEKCITLGLIEMNGHEDEQRLVTLLSPLGVDYAEDVIWRLFRSGSYSKRKSEKEFNDPRTFLEGQIRKYGANKEHLTHFFRLLKDHYGKDWVKELKD